MRSLLSAIGALGALQVLGVYAQSGALDCVPHCAERQRASFVEFVCTNAADSGCLCTKANFWNGVRDCAASCGSGEADAKGYLSSSFCGAVVPTDGAQTSSVSATVAAPTTSTGAPATTAAATESTSSSAAATTAVSSSSAQAATTSETPSSTAPATTASSAASGTTAAASSATEAGSTGTATATSKATGTSTAPAGATSTSSSDKEEGKDEGKESGKSGLSSAAEIGIGVGIGAAVLAIGSVALCFFLRARRRKQQERSGPSFEISQPLPGGGRSYSTPSIEKNTYDLEMVSHRYEDMVPRTTPRNMV